VEADVQLRSGQTQTAGGAGLVPVDFMKYASNRRPFDTSQVCRGGGRLWRRIEREVLRGNQAALAQNRRALESVVQFTHISRPFVLQQRVASVNAQFEVRPTRRLADVLEEPVACSISIGRQNGHVRLEIANDGAGPISPYGQGLSGLAARAAELSGKAHGHVSGIGRFVLVVDVPEEAT